MTDERLQDLLQSAMPQATGGEPSRDLWPMVLRHAHDGPEWSWVDLGLAAAAAVAMLSMPNAWLFIACHL